MKLVADSGSTKTNWRLIAADGAVRSFDSQGINPYFHTEDSVADVLRGLDTPSRLDGVREVFFYAAGANTARTMGILERGFRMVFQDAEIHIFHDLLGAARALYHGESGMVAILGTGSNSCLFVEGEIRANRGGHGYILGDEGSGMHMGRSLICDFMNDLLPPDVLEMFSGTFAHSKDEITYHVYKKPFPNRFLASFAVFVGQNLGHPYFDAMVHRVFAAFFERYIVQYEAYKSLPLRVVGSIGCFFEAPLGDVANAYDVRMDGVLRAPIEGLLAYHK